MVTWPRRQQKIAHQDQADYIQQNTKQYFRAKQGCKYTEAHETKCIEIKQVILQ